MFKHLAKFTQIHLCQTLSFLIRFENWGLELKYLAKFTGKHQCQSVSLWICEIFNIFFAEHLQWLLLYLLVNMIQVKSCEQLEKLTEFFVPYPKYLANKFPTIVFYNNKFSENWFPSNVYLALIDCIFIYLC